MALAGLAAGCNLLDPDRRIDGLDEAKQQWSQAAIDDYQLVIRRICYCLEVEPVRITVVDGVVTARVYRDTGEPVPADRHQLYPAVPGSSRCSRTPTGGTPRSTCPLIRGMAFPPAPSSTTSRTRSTTS
jgi:hypothetical protein